MEGEDCSFRLPNRAIAFVREQVSIQNNDTQYYEFKQGLAYRVQEIYKNTGTKFHELNHCISSQLSMINDYGEVYKSGTLIYSLVDDSFVNKTKNFLNEALTDAIAKHYYDNIYEHPDKTKYNGEYCRQGMTLFGQILLGENLSNTDLINAYLGNEVDLLKFETQFNEITGCDFRKVLKMDLDTAKSIDGENIPIDELVKIAVSYRVNSASTEGELKSEIKFLQSLDILNNLKTCCSNEKLDNLKSSLNKECKNAENNLKEQQKSNAD